MTAIDFTTKTFYNNSADITSFTVMIQPTDEALSSIIGGLFNWQGFLGSPADHANSIFTSFQDAITYYLATYGSDIIGYVDTLLGTTGSTLGTVYNNTYRGTIGLLNAKADISHTQAVSTISDASTIGKTILTAANDSAVRTAIMSPQTHIADAATNSATDAATNATTSLLTNYNLATGILGLANALNDANAAQNDLAAKYNALAEKYNTAASNDNSANTKLNSVFDALEANKILNAA
jgi:hypothetical protein